MPGQFACSDSRLDSSKLRAIMTARITHDDEEDEDEEEDDDDGDDDDDEDDDDDDDEDDDDDDHDVTNHHPAFPTQIASAWKVDDTLGGLGPMMDFRPQQPMLVGRGLILLCFCWRV